ncbi:uncharacterized protein LOC142166395 isoform X5 [Nicotiana tabacum]|uniref:Uncharacterized protein LOC142166395 isoform X5 n=1 Tax=Nicotiana tabacum TaxID=4097 RepID=A0AC58S9J9_TOBAC
MCSFYHEPWRSWSEVPCHIRDRMFTEFRIKCAWSHDLEAEVWTVFFKKCSDRFFDLLRTARENNVRPTWILDDLWVNLLEYWKSLEFEKKSRQGREARMSEKGSSMHTGGSISMETHRRRLAKGRPVTHDEVFEETHMKKLKDGTKITWVETRAETTHALQWTKLSPDFDSFDSSTCPNPLTAEIYRGFWDRILALTHFCRVIFLEKNDET